jgi:pyruvate dehydrogenase E2 component (dihydrolipoamide acetyltransferase)
MSTEIKLPFLGEGIEAGDVLEILVSVGETIKKDQTLLEMETDKATVSVPSSTAGKILSISVKEGQTVSVGSVIAIVEAVGAPASKPTTPTPASVPTTAAPITAPATPAVSKVETPISAPSVPAAKINIPTPIFVPPAAATVTAVVAPATASQSQPYADPGTPFSDDVIPAGPAIRRFAREVGVDLAEVNGSGEGGRITRDDVLSVVRHANQSVKTAIQTQPQPVASVGSASTSAVATEQVAAPKSASATKSALPGTVASDDYGPIRVDRMTKIRKTIAAQMHKSWSTVPRVVNFDDADVTELEAFRQTSKDDYASRGVKLTTMPFLVKAVATALKHHPSLNAMLDMENEQIIYKDYVNIGIAVDSDRGLVVPTLKNSDKMSIPDIAYSLSTLSARVRNNDFAVSDLRGGTFTISNLGAIGGTYSTPIVNVPEVAILLVGRSRKMPIVMDDESIKPRLMMPLSLAYDHRAVDGATAARFLNDVIAYLEAPSRLLLAI